MDYLCQLKIGATKNQRKKYSTKPSILLVSTLDGKLTALDLRNYGELLWSTSFTPENKTLSNQLDSFHYHRKNNQKIHLVPSLNGDLYRCDDECIHAKPIITAKALMKCGGKVDGSTFIFGSQKRNDYILLASTGESITSSIGKNARDIIEITVQICNISYVSLVEENSTNYDLVQYEIMNSKSPDYHARTIPKSYNLSFEVPAGILCCHFRGKKWKRSLGSPIVSAWRINGSGIVTSINLFAKIQRELNSPTKELIPSFYIGKYGDNIYIQNLQSIKSLKPFNAKEITFDIACPASRSDSTSASHLLEKSICYELLISSILTQPSTSRIVVMPPILDQYKSTEALPNIQRSISEPCGNRSTKSHFETHFDFIRRLGKGGFGNVVEVKSKMDSLNYAIKQILMPNTEQSPFRVLREVETLSKCDHPNITRYYSAWLEDSNCQQVIQKLSSGSSNSNTQSSSDQKSYESSDYSAKNTSFEICFEESSKTNETNTSFDQIRLQKKSRIKKYLFIQMELCHSQSLAKYIRTTSVAERKPYIKSILQQITDGVQYIHQQGLIHRDLKPSNIYFSLDYQIVKIGDFGLVTDMPNNANPLEASGSEQTESVGTPLYRSPEQTQNLPYDFKVDIFSMGVIYVELLVDFETNMERVKILSGLKEGRLPKKFAKNNILKRMLTTNKEKRPDIAEIQKLLNYDRGLIKKKNLPISTMFNSTIGCMGIVLLSNNVL